ncbi:MAG: hypothetical protein AB7F89_25505 [Pirellulaceae bacterium]
MPQYHTLEHVYGIVYQNGPPPGKEDAQAGQVIDANLGTFRFPHDLYNVVCDADGNAVNQVKIWCTVRDPVQNTEEDVTSSGSFKGQCISLGRGRARATVPGFPLNPTKRVGRWQQYTHAAVSHPHEGSALLIDGRPLRARSISVAADDVLWRAYDPDTDSWSDVTRPVGRRRPGGETWRFRRLNQNALAVWQIGGSARLIRAGTRANPTTIRNLNPRSPIFAQVNGRSGHFHRNFGTFNLWVRVESE